MPLYLIYPNPGLGMRAAKAVRKPGIPPAHGWERSPGSVLLGTGEPRPRRREHPRTVR